MASLIGIFSGNLVATWFIIVTSTVVIYDHIITSDEEVRLFWTRRRLSSAAALYFFIKYFLLFSSIYILFAAVSRPVQSCDPDKAIIGVLIGLIALPGVFAALRAFALSQSRASSLVILLFYLIPLGIFLEAYVRDFTTSHLGCHQLNYVQMSPTFAIMTRAALMIADVLMMIVTWCALAPVRRTRTTPLHAVLLRDGTVYFVGQFLQNAFELTQIVLSVGSAPLTPYAGQSYISSFTQQIACVLVTRFLLDLQAAHQQTTAWETPSQSQTWFALGGLAQSTASDMPMPVAPADSARVPDAPSWQAV